MNDTEHDDNGDSPYLSPELPPPIQFDQEASPFPDATGELTWVEQPHAAERVEPPRIWPALLVAILALPASWVIAGVVLVVAALAYYGPGGMQSPNWITQFIQTRFGLLVVIVPGQLVFLSATLAAAALSPEAIRQRLALRPGRLPYWTWGVFILATPVVGFATSVLLSQLVDEPSEQLRMMSDMIRAHAHGGFVVAVLLLVGVVPGFVEELLFRGYLQSRLLRRWSPVAAIAVSTLIFAAAHMDPLHVQGVMPLGIWLGLVAWRTGSVWPAMLCHGINNAVAVAGTVSSSADVVEVTFDPITIVTLAVGGPAMLLALAILAKRSSSDSHA